MANSDRKAFKTFIARLSTAVYRMIKARRIAYCDATLWSIFLEDAKVIHRTRQACSLLHLPEMMTCGFRTMNYCAFRLHVQLRGCKNVSSPVISLRAHCRAT